MAELKIEWGHPVALFRFSNPGRANAVTPELMFQLVEAIDRANADDAVEAIVLTGENGLFCAGADLVDMAERMLETSLDELIEFMGTTWMPSVQSGARAIRNARPVMVAAINGPATAGGLDLALNCDYVLAVPTAKLGESYVKLGQLPVAGGTYLLPRRIPLGRARNLLLSGRLITGVEAADLGLVDEIVEPEQLEARARAIASEMSQWFGGATAWYKEAFRIGADELELHFRNALEGNIALFSDPEVRAALVELLQSRAHKIAESREVGR